MFQAAHADGLAFNVIFNGILKGISNAMGPQSRLDAIFPDIGPMSAAVLRSGPATVHYTALKSPLLMMVIRNRGSRQMA